MTKKFYTYAIYSVSYDKIYIGFTSDPEKHLNSHNSSLNRGWTSKYKPWELVYSEEFKTKKDAMLRENQLKTAKGREFIRNTINSK